MFVGGRKQVPREPGRGEGEEGSGGEGEEGGSQGQAGAGRARGSASGRVTLKASIFRRFYYCCLKYRFLPRLSI